MDRIKELTRTIATASLSRDELGELLKSIDALRSQASIPISKNTSRTLTAKKLTKPGCPDCRSLAA